MSGLGYAVAELARAVPVRRERSRCRSFVAGRWWTVLSASWLHGGALHIFMNMMAVRQLAPGVAELYGPGRMVIIYTAGSIVGFALSSFAGASFRRSSILRGGQFTVGASASIAGLIGAVLAYGHRSGSTMARSYASSVHRRAGAHRASSSRASTTTRTPAASPAATWRRGCSTR